MLLATASIAAAILAPCLPCSAQVEHGPVFRLQPGLLTTDFVSAPHRASATGFNLRFETRLPTSKTWLTPVIGAALTPYGLSGVGTHDLNTPVLFAGNVFPAVSVERTGGWATLEIPLLIYYSYGGGGERNSRLYGRDLYLQLALTVHVGHKVLADLGPFWSKLDTYVFLEQNLTPNTTPGTNTTDRFAPAALVGLSIPLGKTGTVP